MAADGVTITLSVGQVALIIERLYAYMIAPKIRTKEEQERKTDSSGDKPPEFWQKAFRDAVMEVNQLQLVPLLEKMVDGHKEVVDMLHSRTMLFQQQIDLMKELVDVNRTERRRR